MSSRLVALVGPIYLFACLTLGGSSQGIWADLLLQLSAILIVALSLLVGRKPQGRAASWLGWLILAAIAVAGIQLIPLPPELWTALPGRQPVVEGFALLGSALPWMPISLAPEATLSAMLACLPAAAMLSWMLCWPSASGRGLTIAVLSATFISVIVGLVQYTSGQWYPYRFSSFGAATGLFANSNHMASLLLCSIPLLAATAAEQWRTTKSPAPAQRLVAISALLLCGAGVVLGIILNGSFAVMLLGGPMLVASALIFLPTVAVRAGRLALLIVAAIGAAIAAMATFGLDRLANVGGAASAAERLDILRSSVRMAVDYAPAGSGLGSFPAVYRLHENPDVVTWTYVNHAHNDYLELAIELGVAGGLLVIAFLLWWGWRFTSLWRSGGTPPLVRAATLVTLGLLLHSLVDFPLRTAALSALFATAIGLMVATRLGQNDDGQGKPRHLTLEDL